MSSPLALCCGAATLTSSQVSFLRWVIDPSTAAFDELDALGSPGGPDSLLADALGLSQGGCE